MVIEWDLTRSRGPGRREENTRSKGRSRLVDSNKISSNQVNGDERFLR
jgi:hypothetical protein